MYVTGSYRLTPRSTECKHLLKDSAFNSLQDRICLQNSLGGRGEQTHSQPSVYVIGVLIHGLIDKSDTVVEFDSDRCFFSIVTA